MLLDSKYPYWHLSPPGRNGAPHWSLQPTTPLHYPRAYKLFNTNRQICGILVTILHRWLTFSQKFFHACMTNKVQVTTALRNTNAVSKFLNVKITTFAQQPREGACRHPWKPLVYSSTVCFSSNWVNTQLWQGVELKSTFWGMLARTPGRSRACALSNSEVPDSLASSPPGTLVQAASHWTKTGVAL